MPERLRDHVAHGHEGEDADGEAQRDAGGIEPAGIHGEVRRDGRQRGYGAENDEVGPGAAVAVGHEHGGGQGEHHHGLVEAQGDEHHDADILAGDERRRQGKAVEEGVDREADEGRERCDVMLGLLAGILLHQVFLHQEVRREQQEEPAEHGDGHGVLGDAVVPAPLEGFREQHEEQHSDHHARAECYQAVQVPVLLPSDYERDPRGRQGDREYDQCEHDDRSVVVHVPPILRFYY